MHSSGDYPETIVKPASRRRLHVVIVDEELPYPPNTGKRLRTFNLLSRLARNHQLTYIHHQNADPEEARRAASAFADHDIETIRVHRQIPKKLGIGFYGKLAANLLSPLPYSVSSHRSSELPKALRAYAASHAVDLWQCEWTPYADNLQDLAGVPRLIMAHNVESVIWQRYFETEVNPLNRWYIGKQWKKFERFERRAFSGADRIVAVSAEDADRIKNQFGAPHVDVVDNGVDTEYFRPFPGLRQNDRIIFVGSLDWRPNLDGVAQLLEKVFPAVQAAIPSARLCIVGRNPPSWLAKQIAKYANIELHGNVPDVRPFLAQSGVMAVPLRIGGGSRLKILEALASGLPVVSTQIGAEGLCLQPGRDLIVVERIDQMAEALVRTICHPDTASGMAECGRKHVLERYDWNFLADRLERIWLDCVNVPRQNSPDIDCVLTRTATSL
ncbi:MAG TPA: glycosyltransferase family 4 protein [Gemmataceae bacterium]|nr:glycosyltransferase family 4 protein [Gemmataceae bacterium]